MHFFKGYTSKYVYNTILLHSPASTIWNEITNVMIAEYKFPILFSLFGIPKPLSAEVIKTGVGGYRVAKFSNKAEFQQNILEWEIEKKYRFKFNPTPQFKVGHVLNLSNGPFEIQTGGYELQENNKGIRLVLSSNYALNGILGSLMHIPFRFVVYHFQKYLLNAIHKKLNGQ